MGDNKGRKGTGRFNIVDPNDMGYQYNGGMFGNTNYNMSVPPEELCIIVELVTTQKARTVLINGQNGTETKNSEGNKIANFINGKKDGSTGYGNFLTTSYTDLGTETIIEEALGITNIQIEFNSSYAPMVNIDFIDVRGGAIFQSGAKSIYNVLFRLPYPLFELKIKGFYGKPVTYCLHMVKCNTKFNSQTGNFEISASFVGYTYAMFADMILGYLRAAVRTPEGEKLLKDKDTISINQFMKDMNNIDKLVEEQLANTSNVNRNNVALANELQSDLTVIEGLVDNFIADLKDPTICEAILGDTPEPYNTSIVFFPDPDPNDSEAFSKTKADNILQEFVDEYVIKRDAYNTKVGDLEGAKLKVTDRRVATPIPAANELIGPDSGVNNTDMIDTVKSGYDSLIDTNNTEEINNVIKRLQNAAPKTLSPSDAYIIAYDVTETRQFIQDARTELGNSQKVFTDALALDIAAAIESKLTFEPNIRNIFKMFAAHIEIFLELMFQVSSKYLETTRIDELKKFRSKDKTKQRLDIKNTEDAVIYPWPEYIEKDEEKYLGGAGVLSNPLLVPEVKFVEDLYAQMVRNIQEDEAVQAGQNGVVAWQAFNPIDSINSITTKPYDRLPDSANQDDIARLIVLRAVGVLGWQPSGVIDDTEIESFANSEAQLIIEKYKTNNIILPALTSNYDNADKYAEVKGIIDGVETNVLTAGKQGTDDILDYKYFYERTYVYALPVDKGFTNLAVRTMFSTSDLFLTTRTQETNLYYEYDDAKYINFIDFNTYDKGNSTSPISSGPSIFKYDGLSKDITTSTEMTEGAGFFLSNGKYGVQEFTIIDYSSKPEYGTNENLSFFSLFYDNPLIDNEYETNLPGLSTPRIQKIGDLSLDMTYSGGNFGTYAFIDNTNIFGNPTDLTNWFFNKLNEPNNNHTSVGKNITLFNNETTQEQVAFPFLNFGIYSDVIFDVPIFGSRFYNAQDSYSAKTFLFLHSLPWRGLMGKSALPDGLIPGLKNFVGIFKQKELINTFKWRSGYIQTPKLWSAFIGGLLWRYEQGKAGTDPIKFLGSFFVDNFIPDVYAHFPKYDEFLKVIPTNNRILVATTEKPITQGLLGYWLASAASYVQSNYPMCFSNKELTTEYPKIDDELIQLPPPAKKMFINEFIKFVEEFQPSGNPEVPNISDILELKPKDTSKGSSDANWKAAWNAINSSTIIDTSNEALVKHDLNNIGTYVPLNNPANINAHLTNGANPGKLEEDYAILTYNYYNSKETTVNGVTIPVTNSINNYNFFIEYKQNGKVETKLKELFFTKQYIENDSVIMWAYYDQIIANARFFKTKFVKYIDTIIQALKAKVAEDQKTIVSPGENEKIKLEIYRTCKKIYDKWIAGVGGSPRPFDDILFQCCSKGTNEPYRLAGDTELNAKYGSKTPAGLNLIDSFRFVSRSFEDISEQFQIHPVMVTHQLYESPDSSIYDLFGRILTDNNFEFIALPNFINFNDPKELHSVFEPYPYYMAQKQTATGPSFVCVYVGQTSTKLDFGPDSQYPNDGFDITNENTWPEDFSQEKASWEDFASAFVVRYGQQNQNIFKDIRLDQSEFNETAESLAITDAISNSLSSANQSYIGQNLYNVYSVRSYKAEVEMMGDAMIQPMMYFQLDNIPMFHGAYLITKVTHNIVPNNMTTVFTGTRIRIAKTPLIDKATLYSSLISGQKIGQATAGSTITSSSQGNFGHIPLPAQQIGNVTVTNLKQSSVMLNGAGSYKNGYPEYVVLHWTAGVKFASPEPNGVGYHFEIDTNGDIIKTCELTNIASHAGCYRNNSEKDSACAQLNGKSIGISYVGGVEKDGESAYVRTWDDWQQTNLSLGAGTYNSKEQWNSIVNAILLAKQQHPTINAITSHHLTSADKADVGDNFPWDALFDDIEKITTAMGTPWRPLFADRWYDDSGSKNLGKLVREFKPNSINALQSPDLLTTLMPAANLESNQPITNASGDGPQLSYIYDYLNTRLKNKNLSIGIMANIAKESGYSPYSTGDKRGDGSTGAIRYGDGKYYCSWGLTQVNVCGGAGPAYLKLYGKENASDSDKLAVMQNTEKHLDFVIIKVKELFPSTWQQERTPEDWAQDFAIQYERCAECKSANDSQVIARRKEASGLKTQSFYTGSNIGSAKQATTLDTIIIGDSLSPCIESQIIKKNGKARRISPNGGEASLWLGGQGVSWLIGALQKYPVTTSVKNVVISIGTNGGFNIGIKDNQAGLMAELRRVFPNAKYVFITGSYGWGGNVSITQANVDTYYNVYKNAGATIVKGFGYVGSDADAHSCSATKIPTLPAMIDGIISAVGG